jgi:hypothetical protein
MIRWIAEHLFCPNCLGFRLGPRHLFMRFMVGE